MDSISYLETRYLNAHIDYKLRASGGSWLQHLSRLPGNEGGIYKTDASKGVISFETEREHSIKIDVGDPNGNTSTLQFKIVSTAFSGARSASSEGIQKQFHPGFINVFENDHLRFYLGEDALYDSFTFRYNETKDTKGNPVYQVHNTTVPLHTYFNLSIQADFSIADTGKIVMYRFSGSKTDYRKAVGQNGWYKAAFREFGNFQLMIDSVPPVIRPLGFVNGMNASRLSRLLFVVTDNTEELKSFTALLDGRWLRFSNDKGRNFIYKFDEHCPPGPHELLITAEDQVGNITQKTYNFTR
jgi:hypothetical protein